MTPSNQYLEQLIPLDGTLQDVLKCDGTEECECTGQCENCKCKEVICL